MSAAVVQAYAKVNLCLEVLGRRDDGYHELLTIFQSVSLADELEVEVTDRPGTVLSVADGAAPEGSDNLCWRAAEAYRAVRGWPQGVSIRLVKRIPAGAGLGGGSSDAAAVVCGLRALDAAPPPAREVERVLAGLGSDVPFFLTGGTALGSGRGDRVATLPHLPLCWIVLVKPALAVSTAEAYGMLEPRNFSGGARARAMAAAIDRGAGLAEIAAEVYSAFAPVLTQRWPVLGELKSRLRRSGALAAEITGSGSAVFGLFGSRTEASAAAHGLSADGLWSCLAHPVAAGQHVRVGLEGSR
ncbi:MAG: 4-(cytidine 5'-diphospho)-2-C-methyl-D-erythritol kinase [Armatimonadota bacterium]